MKSGVGMGFLSEDRKAEGLAMKLSLRENITLPSLRSLGPWGTIRPASEREAALSAMKDLDLKYQDLDQEAETLSGGNQQKTAIARLRLQDADILMLDQPTRGVDIGSRARIYELIDRRVREGRAVLLASDDLGELLGLCDRISVMRNGELAPPLPADTLDLPALHGLIQVRERAA